MRRSTIFLLCGFIFIVLVGCSSESPWDVSVREAREAIERSDYDYAEGLLLEALPRAEMWGESDQRLATVLYNLGEVYRRQNELSKAEPYFWRALPIWAKSVGAEHPEMAAGLTSLAQIYKVRQEYQRAEPLVKQALKIQEKAFGVTSPQILPTLEEYYSLLKMVDRHEDAEKLNVRREAILAKGK